MRCWCLLFLFLPTLLNAAPRGDAEAERVLTGMLEDFLAGASAGDAAAHDRFWSEDLVYTSSNGTRFGKAEIMAGLEASQPDEPDAAPAATYSAEKITVQVYGDAAVVAFRLVGSTPGAGHAEDRVEHYFNTGTFVRQGGAWKVVAWQATRIPNEAGQAPVD